METIKGERAQQPENPQNPGNENCELVHCYGQIGISAVAAAARYQGAGKNPAYAPADLKVDPWAVMEAA